MRRADRLQIRGSTRGLTLLELAVVLALIGVIAAGGTAMLTASIQSSQYNATVARMQAIETALLNFRIGFTRLPCPGDLTLTSGSANYGLEADAGTGSTNAVGSGTCTGGSSTPAANFAATGTNTGGNAYTVAEGAVPTRALRLPDSYMYDGWGNKFRYAVDVAYTTTNAFTTYLPVPGTCAPYGGITVNDSTGAARSSASIYALISHGANGHGAYTNNGTIINGGSTNASELANCSCNSSGSATTFAPTFVQKLPATTTTGNGLTVFDDLVDFRERWQMQAPTGDTAGSCGYVYVADVTNNRIEEYTTGGYYVATIGNTPAGAASGTGNGQFNQPWGLAFDASGSLWVADTNNGRLQKLTSSGSFVMSIGGTATQCATTSCGCTTTVCPWCVANSVPGPPFTCPSTEDGSGDNGAMWDPQNVAIDKSGNVWAEDTADQRIAEYSSSGSWLKDVGGTASACTNCSCTGPSACPYNLGSGNGQLHGPGLSIVFDGSGNLWVTDTTSNSRLVQYSSSGSFLQNIATTYSNARGIAFDGSGSIWVAYSSNDQVQKYSASGSLLLTWPWESGNGALLQPYAIAVDASGSIWLTNYGNHNVNKYNSSGTWLLSIGGTSGSCTNCGCTSGTCPTTSGSLSGQLSGPSGIAFSVR